MHSKYMKNKSGNLYLENNHSFLTAAFKKLVMG